MRPKELPMTVSSEKLSQKPPVKAKVVPARPVVPTKAGVTPNIPDKVPLVGAMWPPKPPSKGLPPRSGATPPRVSSQPSVTVPEATRTTKPSLSVDTQVKMLGSPPVPRPVTPTTAGDTPNVPDGVNLSAVQPVPKPPVQRPVVPARQIETPNVPEGVNLSAVQPTLNTSMAKGPLSTIKKVAPQASIQSTAPKISQPIPKKVVQPSLPVGDIAADTQRVLSVPEDTKRSVEEAKKKKDELLVWEDKSIPQGDRDYMDVISIGDMASAEYKSRVGDFLEKARPEWIRKEDEENNTLSIFLTDHNHYGKTDTKVSIDKDDPEFNRLGQIFMTELVKSRHGEERKKNLHYGELWDGLSDEMKELVMVESLYIKPDYLFDAEEGSFLNRFKDMIKVEEVKKEK